MAWAPYVVKNTEAGTASVYVRDGEREHLVDIVSLSDQEALDWAEERAWMKADEFNEQDQ